MVFCYDVTYQFYALVPDKPSCRSYALILLKIAKESCSFRILIEHAIIGVVLLQLQYGTYANLLYDIAVA